MAKYRGTGVITDADFKNVKWVGKTKGEKACTITLNNAINLGNINWVFAEKNDTVAQIVMTATYDNTDTISSSTDEPWSLEIDGAKTEFKDDSSSVLLGVGVFYIENTAIALTRGGGQFDVEREYRRINADGDRGPVKGRISMESSEAKLTINALTFLARVSDLYPGIAETASTTSST